MNAYFNVYSEIRQSDIEYCLKHKAGSIKEAIVKAAALRAEENEGLIIPESYLNAVVDEEFDYMTCEGVEEWAEECVLSYLAARGEYSQYIKVNTSMLIRDSLITGDLIMLAYDDNGIDNFIFVYFDRLDEVIDEYVISRDEEAIETNKKAA